MADFTQWPTPNDVAARLDSAGIALRDEGYALARTVLDGLADEVACATMVQFIADAADTTRTYDGTGTAELEIDPMVALTSVAVTAADGTPTGDVVGATLAGELYRPRSVLVVAGAANPVRAVFPSGRANIAVTGRFGYGETVPRDLWAAVQAEAALRLAQEALCGAKGQIAQWADHDASLKFQPGGATAIGWHALYVEAIGRYRRPAGRRMRSLRARMV